MRTTLDIEHDVLRAAMDRARWEKKTLGLHISELARRPLTETTDPQTLHCGVRPFEKRGGVVTNEVVDRSITSSTTQLPMPRRVTWILAMLAANDPYDRCKWRALS